MGVKQKFKSILSFLIHGEPKKVFANITYSEPNLRLKGKRAIITGGGRGLGLAMAKKFIAEGAVVLIAGRNEKVLKESAETIGCTYLSLDISKPDEFKSFIKIASEKLGGLDVLVNNAGISLHEKTFFDVTPETFDAQVDTNFKGGFFLTQEFIRYLKNNNKAGNILFISSETGDTMDFRPYGFTKVAVNSMVQGLAYLFSKESIRINAVAPGITASEMTGLSSEGDIYYPYNLNERVYLPDEIAEVACFMVSDASGCISGQIITCNNARTINARWK